jgi:hypothetical protein
MIDFKSNPVNKIVAKYITKPTPIRELMELRDDLVKTLEKPFEYRKYAPTDIVERLNKMLL